MNLRLEINSVKKYIKMENRYCVLPLADCHFLGSQRSDLRVQLLNVEGEKDISTTPYSKVILSSYQFR